MYCTNCGAKIEAGYIFCANCGGEVNKKHEVSCDSVAELSLKGFNNFWANSEVTITPLVAGVFDIEGGQVEISGQWFEQCDCTDEIESFQIECQRCGRNRRNHMRIRSGHGDGAYMSYQLAFDRSIAGALIIFDKDNENANFFAQSVSHAAQNLGMNDGALNQNFRLQQDFFDSYLERFYFQLENVEADAEIHYAGEIHLGNNPLVKGAEFQPGLFIVGESGESANSTSCLISMNSLHAAAHRVFIFANRVLDQLANAEILIPQQILVLRNDVANSIGLSPDRFKALDMDREFKLWNKSVVLARIGEPLGPWAVSVNDLFARMKFSASRVDSEIGSADAYDYLLEVVGWTMLSTAFVEDESVLQQIAYSLKEMTDQQLQDALILHGQTDGSLFSRIKKYQ